MPLKQSPLSDAMCNAALKVALDPFMVGTPEFDITSGPRPGITWRAVEDGHTMVLQLRTEGRGMSYIRTYEKGDPVVVAGFSESEGWVEILVAGTTLRSPLADAEVTSWIRDLENAARNSLGEDFVMGHDGPKP